MPIQQNVDLAAFNTFGVHCNARYLAEINSLQDLESALGFAQDEAIPIQLLGGGSNVLFSQDYPGLILHMKMRGIECLNEPGRVKVAAGENWHKFVMYCLNKELYGIENLALIPGTAGAAPIQNIGAYGVELEDFFGELEVYDMASGQRRIMDKADCQFGYRDSVFKQELHNRIVVLSLTLQLSPIPAPCVEYPALAKELKTVEPTPQEVFEVVCHIRQTKLPEPTTLANAGSFFKNPVVSEEKYAALLSDHGNVPRFPTFDEGLVKIPAAWFLEILGWKGERQGPVGVHDLQPLVIVNYGGASGADILNLAEDMSASVLEKFAIVLQTEVRII
jgi:UDP-N-acetylmuramate dehydrogenase